MSNPTFSLWRCCLTGEAKNPKLKKKSTTDNSKQNGTREPNHNNEEKLNKDEVDMDSVCVDEHLSSTKYEETESGFNDTEAGDDSTIAPSEVESTISPSTVQIVKDGDTDSTPQITDIGTGGRLHLTCRLDKKANKIHIQINKIEFGPYQDWKMEDLEVSCMLLPMHQQSFRRRSKRFSEPIAIQLPKAAKLSSSSLRFRIYDHKSITSKFLIGQGQVSTESLFNVDGSEVTALLDLNAPGVYSIDTRYISGIKTAGDSTGDSARPEILISFEYRGLTRKLIVEVVKTRGLGLLSGAKPQDIAVEVNLTAKDKQVVKNCRTAVKKHVIDTEFNELFMFRISKERLNEVTLQLVVVRYTDTAGIRNRKIIGECSFGMRSSGNEQQEHWDSLSKADAKTEYCWHPLYK